MHTKLKLIIIALLVFFSSLCFAQTERWVYIYAQNLLHRSGAANSIVYGPDGNLYAGGSTCNAPGASSCFTVISLTDSGSERWVYKYPTLNQSNGEVYAVIYGLDGNMGNVNICVEILMNNRITVLLPFVIVFVK